MWRGIQQSVAGKAAPCGNFQRSTGVESADLDNSPGRLASGKKEQVEKQFTATGLAAIKVSVCGIHFVGRRLRLWSRRFVRDGGLLAFVNIVAGLAVGGGFNRITGTGLAFLQFLAGGHKRGALLRKLPGSIRPP